MIHFHGTPCGGKREDVARFLSGRHALIPFGRIEDIGTAAEVCQSFVLDNGAFSAWRKGTPISDWSQYYAFVEKWKRHPGFAWAIIPDVIDGDEQANNDLLSEWPFEETGVPVWHLHESLHRLEMLVCTYQTVALGSSGQFRNIGTRAWKERIAQAMEVACDETGRPRAKLHGLRMLDPAVFQRLPLASADSTNAARNGVRKANEMGCNALTGMTIVADRIEKHQSASAWIELERQRSLMWDDAEVLFTEDELCEF